MLQDSFSYRGGSDKPKSLQKEGLDRRGGLNTTHYFTIGGAEKINKISQFI